jgi:ribosomal protein S18 acetylase RimI-like enzyme
MQWFWLHQEDRAMELTVLTPDCRGALHAFYAGLPPAVTTFFEPFGPVVTVEVLSKHLADAAAGTHVSLGLTDAAGAIHGHVFILNVRSDAPVFGIGLAESAQGQGWGRRMAQAVLAEAAARGASRVTLTVVKENTRAWTLYESLGFRKSGETTFKTANDSYCMERG